MGGSHLGPSGVTPRPIGARSPGSGRAAVEGTSAGNNHRLFRPRWGRKIVPGRASHLIAICALLAACSSPGASGDGGGGSFGGRPICYNYAVPCVPSCGATDMSTPSLDDCEGTGAISCPPDTVFLSTCPPNACAQLPIPCCNESTGDLGLPVCGTDGFWSDCPAGSHSAASRLCIPNGLDVSHCIQLNGTGCSSTGLMCWEGGAYPLCSCRAGDAGMLWSCVTTYL
jgi:hypothetical protein